MAEYLERINLLVGGNALEKIKEKTVLLAGCGGVGSFVAEALCRSGLGHIILVDDDRVEASNLNRQLHTSKRNIGQLKVEALKEHLEMISDTQISFLPIRVDEHFELPECDYVADCVDDLKAKFHLAKLAHEKDIPYLGAMGSALRLRIAEVVCTTLNQTQNDPLAKRYRDLVKKSHYDHPIRVVYCKQAPDVKPLGNKVLPSAIFTVGTVGLKMAEVIFNDLCKEE